MWSPPAGRPRGAAVGGLLRSAWPRARVVVAGQRRQAARAFVDSRLTSPPPRTTTRAAACVCVRAPTRPPDHHHPLRDARCGGGATYSPIRDHALLYACLRARCRPARRGRGSCIVRAWAGDECDGRPQPS